MRGHSSASFLLLSGILAQTTSALALYNLSITRQGDDGADPLLLLPVFGVPQNDSGLPHVRLPLTATAMADLTKAENTRWYFLLDNSTTDMHVIRILYPRYVRETIMVGPQELSPPPGKAVLIGGIDSEKAPQRGGWSLSSNNTVVYDDHSGNTGGSAFYECVEPDLLIDGHHGASPFLKWGTPFANNTPPEHCKLAKLHATRVPHDEVIVNKHLPDGEWSLGHY